MCEPYASTCTESRMVTDARPVRTPETSRRTCSSCASIRFLTSTARPFKSLTSIGPQLALPDCQDWQNCREAPGLRCRADCRLFAIVAILAVLAMERVLRPNDSANRLAHDDPPDVAWR